ncbi:MAG: ParA family protein [Candidatus Omnitrophota bacterium]|jgi:chromosome partitioning protein|nr:MAG: ParA family protein [Candidatus Omnitrophota bacterium]
MGKTIVICNQKGGTGKTTSAVNLSACFAMMGKKTLLIDLDPQANATSGLGINRADIKKSAYHILMEECSADEIKLKTSIYNLELIPSNLDLTGAEIELVGALGREHRLKKALLNIKNNHEFIIIDSPPSLGLLTINALCAANSILIPVQSEYFALEGLSQLLHTVELVRNNLNQELYIEGVFLTMADVRTNLSREVIQEVKNHFKDKVYNTIIPRNIRLGEAPSYGKPISLYDKASIGAQKYEELSREILGLPATNNRLDNLETNNSPDRT